MALAILNLVGTGAQMWERAMAATAFLLSFDTYARGGDAPQLLASELIPPMQGQLGAAAAWCLTNHPTGGKCSKTGKFDHTVTVGTTHPD